MDAEGFRKYGREMVDYIADYLKEIRERPVVHRVKPGYLKKLIPDEAPEKPEEFSEVMKDIERVIMPGITHWHSPYFHAYYAAGNSFPSILGDMLSDAIGCIGFSWAASPACTELEMITTDWLGKMISLPEQFLHCGKGKGGGVIQTTASETVFLCLLAARNKMVTKLKSQNPALDELEIISKLVGYTSDQANSSVHRSGLLGSVTMVKLQSDEKFSLHGDLLKQQIEKDKAEGKIPFFMCASLGTTGSCAFDRLDEIGPICKENDIWLHIDAAYAGSAFVCPEFRHYMKGVEFAQTFTINPHKWMLISFDLSVLWIQDSSLLVDAFNVDPIYLRHENEGNVPDYRHWQIPLGRRFRSLKLWFMLRSYGVEGVQKYIRHHCELAHEFERMVLDDGRFEIVAEVVMGLVCFRLKGDNILSEKLLEEIVADGRLYLIPAIARDIYFLRLAVCSERTTSEDIRYSFGVIKSCTDIMMKCHLPTADPKHKPMIDIDISPRRLHVISENDVENVSRGMNGVSLNGNSADLNGHSPVGK
ncbi:aromatic-L-amino-acid decarboxylase-like [Ruditapes philippinarum]|uniref:aromatic-L-amino-acid decarboxylase-like n=1 Tax=Ruditapes philippinarum TaxID=129788 RepID=UPI00295ADC62|nr:aromatic-L-amino-acid decarboxylase-like [Ruditapes philippinarum]